MGPSAANFSPPNSVIEKECLSSLGKKIEASPGLEEQWRWKQQMNKDEENPFFPFKLELDWRVADWVIRDSPLNSLCNRFLNVLGVMCSRLYWNTH